VETKLRHADETVDLRLAEAYHWLLVPMQPEAAGAVDFDVVRLNGVGSLAKRVSDKLVRDNHLNLVYTPVLLRLQLDRIPLWPDGHIRVADLWENLARYPYLPRLRDRAVLERTVADGPRQLLWESEGFAVADGLDESTGRYLGLVCGGAMGRPAGDSTGTTLLVTPEVALRQAKADAPLATAAEPSGFTPEGALRIQDADAASPIAIPAQRLRRFHGTAQLDPQRVNRDVARLTQELIEHLTSLVSTDVEVTMEIQASNPDGFPEDVVRTVSENAHALHLASHGFEER
jgi:hypothetical protein